MAKISFFVEACYKVAFKVRLGTPPAFVVLGVVAWLPMQGRWFIHPRYFSSLQMLDTVIFDIWYAIQMSLMSAWLHSIKAYGHSVTSVVALRAPHGPVVSHWYSCMTHAFPSKIIYWFIWSIWWWFWGNCVFSLSPAHVFAVKFKHRVVFPAWHVRSERWAWWSLGCRTLDALGRGMVDMTVRHLEVSSIHLYCRSTSKCDSIWP